MQKKIDYPICNCEKTSLQKRDFINNYKNNCNCMKFTDFKLFFKLYYKLIEDNTTILKIEDDNYFIFCDIFGDPTERRIINLKDKDIRYASRNENNYDTRVIHIINCLFFFYFSVVVKLEVEKAQDPQKYNQYNGIKDAIIYLLISDENIHLSSSAKHIIDEFHQKYFYNTNHKYYFFINPNKCVLSQVLSMMANLYATNFLKTGDEKNIFYKNLLSAVQISIERLYISDFCFSLGNYL